MFFKLSKLYTEKGSTFFSTSCKNYYASIHKNYYASIHIFVTWTTVTPNKTYKTLKHKVISKDIFFLYHTESQNTL